MLFTKINLYEDRKPVAIKESSKYPVKISLNESVILNEAFIQPVKELTDSFNSAVKQSFESGVGGGVQIDWEKPEEYFVQGVTNTKWSEAYSFAGAADGDNVIKLFIQTQLIPNSVSQSEVDSWGDILVSLIRQLGFKENENPFLTFIKLINFELSKDNVITINNLWSDRYIEPRDLNALGPDKQNHIIFNQNLYSLDDSYNIVKYYSDLSEKGTTSRLNIKYILDNIDYKPFKTNLSKLTLDEDGYYEGSPVDVRNALIYENAKPGDPINSYYMLQRAMSESTDYKNENSSYGKQKTTDDYEKAIKKDLTGQQITDLVKGLIKSGSVSIDDLK